MTRWPGRKSPGPSGEDGWPLQANRSEPLPRVTMHQSAPRKPALRQCFEACLAVVRRRPLLAGRVTSARHCERRRCGPKQSASPRTSLVHRIAAFRGWRLAGSPRPIAEVRSLEEQSSTAGGTSLDNVYVNSKPGLSSESAPAGTGRPFAALRFVGTRLAPATTSGQWSGARKCRTCPRQGLRSLGRGLAHEHSARTLRLGRGHLPDLIPSERSRGKHARGFVRHLLTDDDKLAGNGSLSRTSVKS